MKIISSGDIYEVRGDSLKTYDRLPVQVYAIRFSPMMGFYLERHADVEMSEPKIYGPHEKKAEKVLRNYKNMTRNLGVLLSGDKGMGKSMFARILTKKVIEAGMPLIIVDTYYKGIADYIEKICQEVAVLFDEFDKIFTNRQLDDGVSPQTELLSLFDGLSSGKKLFVITCNSINSINEYLINRPGRFHYHIRFEYPTADEVREYLEDNLIAGRKPEISKIVAFSQKVSLNYDCLRSIVFELNNGEESFESAIKDLNILNTDSSPCILTAVFESGETIDDTDSLNLFSSSTKSMVLYDNKNDYVGCIKFEPIAGQYDSITGNVIIPGNQCKLMIDNDAGEKWNNEKLSYVIIQRKKGDNLRFML